MSWPRGDKRWGRFSNKESSPDNGIPLWQVLNPFTYGLEAIDRITLQELVAQNGVVGARVRTSNEGLYYAVFRNAPPLKRELFEYRKIILNFIPDYIKRNLSDQVVRKYSFFSRERIKEITRVPVRKAVKDFCNTPQEFEEVYTLIHSTPELKNMLMFERVNNQARQYVRNTRLIFFRKKLFDVLPVSLRSALTEDIHNRYAYSPKL